MTEQTQQNKCTQTDCEAPETPQTTNFTFGAALQQLKEGKCISREGWNGKGMFLVKAGGYSVPKDKVREGTVFTKEFLENRGLESFDILPHIDMWTAQNNYVSGWLASQTDMFANDWCIVEPK